VTRVLIVSPSGVVRAGLQTVLESGHGLDVVGAVPALDAPDLPDADVVLLELGSRDAPIPVSQEIGAAVLLGDLDPGEGLRRGARAVLPRNAEGPEIIAAVEAAAAGLVVIPPDMIERVLPAGPIAAEQETPREQLTAREIEVLTMLAEGEGNKQIARRLGISEHTVKFHVGSILGKLNASSRTEAVTAGLRQGLIVL
jgi:DNA-binding NarL/FixJ family response regulator